MMKSLRQYGNGKGDVIYTNKNLVTMRVEEEYVNSEENVSNKNNTKSVAFSKDELSSGNENVRGLEGVQVHISRLISQTFLKDGCADVSEMPRSF